MRQPEGLAGLTAGATRRLTSGAIPLLVWLLCLISLAGGRFAVFADSARADVASSVELQADVGHSGRLWGAGVVPPLQYAWSVPLSKWFYSFAYPVITDGLVIAAEPLTNELLAVSLASGQVAWRVSTDLRYSDGEYLAADGDRVFLVGDGDVNGSANTGVEAFDATTGRQLWRANPAGDGPGSPVVSGGVLYLNSGGGPRAAVRESDGMILWSIGGDADHAPITLAANTLVGFDPCGNGVGSDPSNGQPLWSYSGPCTTGSVLAGVAAGGYVWFGDPGAADPGGDGSDAGNVALDPATGKVAGQFPVGSSPVFADGMAVQVRRLKTANNPDGTVSYGGDVAGFDPGSGATRWTFTGTNGSHDVATLPLAADGYVFAASSGGGLWALDPSDGHVVWSGQPPAAASAMGGLAAGDGYIVVLAADHLIAYRGSGSPSGPAPSTWTQPPPKPTYTPPPPPTLTCSQSTASTAGSAPAAGSPPSGSGSRSTSTSGSSGSQTTVGWGGLGGDPARTASVDAPGLQPPFQVLWSKAFTPAASSSSPRPFVSYPVVGDGAVIVATYGDSSAGSGYQLLGFDEQTGGPLWSCTDYSKAPYGVNLALDGTRLFVIGLQDEVIALDARTGQQLWTRPTSGDNDEPLEATGGVLYYSTSDVGAQVHAVDEATGDPIWEQDGIFNATGGGPIVAGNDVYLLGGAAPDGQGGWFATGYGLDRATGKILWHATKGSGYSDGCSWTEMLAASQLWSSTCGYTVNNVDPGERTDPAAGATLGQYNDSGVNSPVVDGGEQMGLIEHDTCTPDGTSCTFQSATLTATETANGKTLWSFDGDGHLSSGLVRVNHLVYVGSFTGRLYAIDDQTGQLVWSTLMPDGFTPEHPFGHGDTPTGIAADGSYLIVPAGNTLTVLAPTGSGSQTGGSSGSQGGTSGSGSGSTGGNTGSGSTQGSTGSGSTGGDASLSGSSAAAQSGGPGATAGSGAASGSSGNTPTTATGGHGVTGAPTPTSGGPGRSKPAGGKHGAARRPLPFRVVLLRHLLIEHRRKLTLLLGLRATGRYTLRTITIALPHRLILANAPAPLRHGIDVRSAGRIIDFKAKILHGRLEIILARPVSTATIRIGPRVLRRRFLTPSHVLTPVRAVIRAITVHGAQTTVTISLHGKRQ